MDVRGLGKKVDIDIKIDLYLLFESYYVIFIIYY